MAKRAKSTFSPASPKSRHPRVISSGDLPSPESQTASEFVKSRVPDTVVRKSIGSPDPWRSQFRAMNITLPEKRDLMLMENPVSGVDLAYRLCRDFGATPKDLCKFFEIDDNTLYRYMDAMPELKDAVVRGRDERDTDMVEASLFRRAMGYDYVEETRELVTVVDPDGEKPPQQAMVSTRQVAKHVPPDTISLIFWLKNRNRARWMDVQDQNLNLRGKLQFQINSSIPEPDVPPKEG